MNEYPIETYFESDWETINGKKLEIERANCYDNLNPNKFDISTLKNYGDRYEIKVVRDFERVSSDCTPLEVACFANGYIRAWNPKATKGFPFGCKVIQISPSEYIVKHYKGY